MPITPWISAVSQIKNGEDVSAEVVNPILAQHTQREQHLYEKFGTVEDKSVLIAYDLPVFLQDPVVLSKNKVVYYNREVVSNVVNEGLDLAQVEFIVRPGQSSFAAANSSYSIGIVKEMNNGNQQADVYIMGLVELDVDIDDPTNGLIQQSEINQAAPFEPGPFFLSRTAAGKLTRNPGGVAIYVGYAFDRRTFLLSPNVSEFNQFYTTYRYNILDRPAGRPLLTTGTWTITNVDDNRVGWIDVADLPDAYVALAPTGAKYFYNLPEANFIASDTGISESDQLEQADLAKNLPPNPPNLTNLIVNGVIQNARDDYNPNGVYVVNDLGIWWFDDSDGNQPWASDIAAKVAVTADASTDEIFLAAHGFAIDDVVRFTTTTTLPSPLVADTDYYVVALNGDGNHFKVSLTVDGAAVDITDAGTGTHYIDQPYIWKFQRGSDAYRPKISLQFIRINPSIRDAVVTSLAPYNTGNNALRYYKADKSGIATTGDLLARLLLDFEPGTAATTSGTAIKSLSYSETTGIVTYVETPIVSNLTQGNGITISPVTVGGVTQPGSYIIASSTNNSSGRVNSIEPDGADLLFSGLHSYINMTVPSVLPSSIIGKITLPTGIPSADMTFVLLLIGTESFSTTKTVEFELTYAVSKNGSLIDTTTSTPVLVDFNMPNPYTAKTVFKVGNTTGAIANPTTLRIPASAFAGGDCAVNFKLARKQAASTPLTTPIGIVDIYWKIG